MTAPKIRPCARCLDGGDPVLMTYDHGWKHVECLDCDQLGPGEGRADQAIRRWNAEYARPTPALAASPHGGGR